MFDAFCAAGIAYDYLPPALPLRPVGSSSRLKKKTAATSERFEIRSWPPFQVGQGEVDVNTTSFM
jgi:hypothetical protein